MSYEIEGKLVKKFDTEQKTDTFKAREFVIETKDDKYPQLLKFQLTQDRCDIIDSFEEDQTIRVHFNLRGREWNEKYFTNLNAWRVEGVEFEQDLNQVGEDFDDPSFDDDEPKYEDFEDTPF